MTVAATANARAQGLPDLSKAPADIQAIWKKTMSGQAPTQAEAKKLSDWMQANRDAVVKAALERAKAASAQVPALASQATAARAAVTTADPANSCPARTPALSRLANAAPSTAGAAALLDSLRTTYATQGKPAALRAIDDQNAKHPIQPALNVTAGAYYLAGYDAPAIITYVAAIKRAAPAQLQKAWGDLGAALSSMQDGVHAVPALLYALSIGPRNAWLVHNLGVAYADLGDLAKADALLSEAARLAPTSSASWDALARVQSCEGSMTAAWHSLAQAQDNEFKSSRQKTLDRHDERTGQDADDTRAEAAKPLPMPAPSWGGRPAPYSAPTPALPNSFRDALGRGGEYIATSNAYGNEMRLILQPKPRKPGDTAAHQAAAAEAAGMTIVIGLSNGKEAEDGSTLAYRRAGARLTVALADLNEASMRQSQAIAPRYAALIDARSRCNARHGTDCDRVYCRAVEPVATEDFQARKALVSQYIGNLAAIAEKYNTVMSAWFAFANDPDYRRDIDRWRRVLLATIARDQYLGAVQVTAGAYGNACVDRTGRDAARADADSGDAQNPGKCESKSKNFVLFSISADCKHMSLTVKSIKLDYQRAASGRNGSIFVGLTASAPGNILSGDAGMKVTFDQGGWVQGFGPAAAGSAGITSLTGSVSEEGMVNLLDHGPAATGSFSANDGTSTSTVNFSVNAAPHFGGKM